VERVWVGRSCPVKLGSESNASPRSHPRSHSELQIAWHAWPLVMCGSCAIRAEPIPPAHTRPCSAAALRITSAHRCSRTHMRRRVPCGRAYHPTPIALDSRQVCGARWVSARRRQRAANAKAQRLQNIVAPKVPAEDPLFTGQGRRQCRITAIRLSAPRACRRAR
jgi:hypothetical protein